VNLVVFVSDALRTDAVGCFGARFVNTRTVDGLAARGARFDNAVTAAPWTCPSMTSMVTGQYPHHHGVLHWDAPAPAGPNLFALTRAHGLAVASAVFDRDYLFKNLPDANVIGTSERLDGAIEWLRANAGGPFLLFVHSWATHMPYDIHHAERREWRAAKQELIDGIQSDRAGALQETYERYTRAVEHMSEVVLASLLEELESLGVADSTAVAFLSDHGESWGERLADKDELQGIYHMHGATLHEEVVQVPLIVTAPGRIDPVEIDSQVRSVDLVPTLLELAGAPVPTGLDGRSLLPLIDGGEQGDRPAVIAGTDMGALSQLAVRVPPWKLIRHLGDGREEAYRLDDDPRERASRDDAPAELREMLDAELATAVGREALAEDEEAVIEARLADLGYL